MTLDSKLPDFARFGVNLASPRLDAAVIAVSDEFFAAGARLLQDEPAVFKPDVYDDNGKWMDGWETRRRRDQGHDHCIVRLGVAGQLTGVDIDTRFFTGNYPPAASIDACLSETPTDSDTEWVEVLPAVTLGPDTQHFLPIADAGIYDHLRLNIYPDGGVARLRVYGEPAKPWRDDHSDRLRELSALRNGGRVIAFNDAHYGDSWSILCDGRGRNMGDGWETRRRREPGNDWILVELGAPGIVEKVEVDTAHFKGNYPDRCSLQAALVERGTVESLVTQSMFWDALMGHQILQADSIHQFDSDALQALGPVSHVKLNIYPDGGISRLRIFGRLA